MWLFSTQGFYSVVAHRDDPDLVLVRCRTEADIEALRRQIPELEPFEDASADYRWRAIVPRHVWRDAMATLADEIDYGNFKSMVAQRQSRERAALYGELWWKLRPLQE